MQYDAGKVPFPIEGSMLSMAPLFLCCEGMMMMCRSTVATLSCVLLASCGGCGKSQPGNQVAAAPDTQVVTGTVIYHQTGPVSAGSSQSMPSAGGAALPPSTANRPAAGATTATPTLGAPAAGSAAASTDTGAVQSNPSTSTVGTTTSAGPMQTTSPPLPTGQPAPAGTAANAPAGTSGNPAVGPSATGASRESSNVVPSGNVTALAAAINQWRAQGKDLVGAKRLNDKPVLAGYSWMTHLLPYLGHQDLYQKFDFAKGWHEKENIVLACEEIPAFLDPMNGNRHMTIIGVKEAIGPAFTHFVGMAGVEDTRNMVAAELPRSDKRAGIFGYDKIASQEEITDGLSNTVMIVSAGKIVGPWASGGGATVRGARAPYFDDITGFGSAGDPGAGALVAMADGSVKRIAKGIDPAVFRALCTIHGAESVDLTAHANAIRPQ